MGFFDTLLTAIAPERAVKRVAAQTAIRAINSGYSNYGASLHKKSMRGWMWHGGSPKEDIEDNLRVLRERSRDAYMGVPLATGAIKTMRTNVVCGGLTPTPQIDNAFLGISDEEAQKINEQIAREFALWANKPTCDADRIDNFYMLQQLAFTGFLLNGDSWAVLQNKKTPGVPYDLRVRIIEADRICSPAFMDILSPTDINEHHVEKIVQGVETDADGMVIAYWVCDRHPLASTSVTGLTASHWTRVEAYGKKTGRQNVLCLMQRERAGQLRGVYGTDVLLATANSFTGSVLQADYNQKMAASMIMPNGLMSRQRTMTGAELKETVRAFVEGCEGGFVPFNRGSLPVVSGIAVEVKENNGSYTLTGITRNGQPLGDNDTVTVTCLATEKQMEALLASDSGTSVGEDTWVKNTWRDYISGGAALAEPENYMTLR